MKFNRLIPYFICAGSLWSATVWGAAEGAQTGVESKKVVPSKKEGDATKADLKAPAKSDAAKGPAANKSAAPNAALPTLDASKAEDDARRKLVVATVNDQVITLGDMEDALASQPPMFRQEYATKEKQKELLDSLIKAKLMAIEAKRRGYDKDQEVTGIAKNKLASLMHKQLVESADSVAPTEEDLKKYYDAHLADYHKPEKARARQIIIKDKAKAEALLKELLSKKPELHEFRKVAKENTEDEAGKSNGGDLGFFTEPAFRAEGDPDVPKPVVDAVFSLKKNSEMYPKLVETDKGYAILMRTGYRAKLDIPFEEAKDRLDVLVRRDLRQTTVEAGIEKLKEKFPLNISEENLKHVVIDLSEEPTAGTPPAAPGE
jgi:parvulin-like peptidyl-prolyl isomerase